MYCYANKFTTICTGMPYIYIYIYTKSRYEEKSVLPGYLHLFVHNGNFICLLSSSGQEWQFYMSTDILWPRMAIAHV